MLSSLRHRQLKGALERVLYSCFLMAPVLTACSEAAPEEKKPPVTAAEKNDWICDTGDFFSYQGVEYIEKGVDWDCRTGVYLDFSLAEKENPATLTLKKPDQVLVTLMTNWNDSRKKYTLRVSIAFEHPPRDWGPEPIYPDCTWLPVGCTPADYPPLLGEPPEPKTLPIDITTGNASFSVGLSESTSDTPLTVICIANAGSVTVDEYVGLGDEATEIKGSYSVTSFLPGQDPQCPSAPLNGTFRATPNIRENDVDAGADGGTDAG